MYGILLSLSRFSTQVLWTYIHVCTCTFIWSGKKQTLRFIIDEHASYCLQDVTLATSQQENKQLKKQVGVMESRAETRCVCVCVCVYVRIYTCTYIYMYMYSQSCTWHILCKQLFTCKLHVRERGRGGGEGEGERERERKNTFSATPGREKWEIWRNSYRKWRTLWHSCSWRELNWSPR